MILSVLPVDEVFYVKDVVQQPIQQYVIALVLQRLILNDHNPCLNGLLARHAASHQILTLILNMNAVKR